MIDPILLGDNAFIGVDHFSQEAGREKATTFSNEKNIVDIISFASDIGIGGLVASTHPNLKNVINYIIQHTDLSKKINIYPIIPYVQGYVVKITERGIIGAVNDILEPASMQQKIGILMKSGVSFLKKDIYGLVKTFVDVELLSVKKMNTPVVFLHDVITDLALGLKSKEIFEVFINYIKDEHGSMPGLVTKNFPLLVKQLDRWGLEMPLIMTSFNKAGFQMNPSKEDCEKCLKDFKVDVIAMSTLAAGYIKPSEAYEYLFELPNIKSVVVGTSTKAHVIETFNILKKHFANYGKK